VPYVAIVLAGGRGTRLGGRDKAAVEVAGRSLLERALSAVAGASAVVVVGDERPVASPVPLLWTRESPAYGGPVAATYAGLDALWRDSPVRLGRGSPSETAQTHRTIPIVVLAVDMPGVTAGTVARLVEGVEGYDGAVLTDGGRRHLAMAVRADALEAARPERTEGAAVRDLWARLDLADVPALGEEAQDVDVPGDITARSDPGA
jgi:molybdopterin-guanine dinucleotide biosynthesis protein A